MERLEDVLLEHGFTQLRGDSGYSRYENEVYAIRISELWPGKARVFFGYHADRIDDVKINGQRIIALENVKAYEPLENDNYVVFRYSVLYSEPREVLAQAKRIRRNISSYLKDEGIFHHPIEANAAWKAHFEYVKNKLCE